MKELYESIAVEPRRQLQFVITSYGTMTFKTQKEAYEFYCTIRTWGEFHTREEGWCAMPRTLVEAVTYHLAYKTGGFDEVEKIFETYTAKFYREEKERAAAKEAYRPQLELRYAVAALAPRDSAEYRSHHDMSYPGYLWGG